MREIWRAWRGYCRDPKNKWDFFDQTRAGLIIGATGLVAYHLLVVLTAGY